MFKYYSIVVILLITSLDIRAEYITNNELGLSVVANKQDTVKIIIDAGHGGHDPGCSGNHSKEKDICLSIALLTGDKLNNLHPNIKALYTRTTDVFVPLHERINIANKSDADLFISIHCNASSNKSAHGSESYIMGIHKTADNLKVAKRENQVITLEDGYTQNYGQYDPDSPAGHIILSMFQNMHLEQSISLANIVESNFSNINNYKSRGLKQAGFVVLRNATMPSILIEAGFLTNKKNEAYLLSDKGKEQIATSISNAVMDFVNSKILSTQNSMKTIVLDDNKLDHKPSNKKRNESSVNKRNKIPIQRKSNIIYKIQLAATRNKTINQQVGKWAKITDLLVVKENDLYKYYTGTFLSKEKATLAKTKLRENGFKGAFIVSKNENNL